MPTPLLPHPVPTLGLLAELEQHDAVLYARKAQALVDYEADCRRRSTTGKAVDFIALDLAVACGIAQSTATHRLAVAQHLVHDLPGTHRLLAEGVLHVGQGLALLEETKGLSRALCARLEEAVLTQLIDLSTGDTRRLVKKTLLHLDVEAGEARRQQQHRERRAFLSPKPDGRAFIGIYGSAEAASGFWAELSQLARLTYGSTDPRTLDQQRADLALALPGFARASRHGHGPTLRTYLGLPDQDHRDSATGCELARRNTPTPAQQRRTQAVVLIPVQTALGLADDPAELLGYGPISGPHARDLLADAELRHACADLNTGRLIALSDQIVQPPEFVGRYWGSIHPPTDTFELDLTPHHPDTPKGPPPGPPPSAPPRAANRRRPPDPDAGVTAARSRPAALTPRPTLTPPPERGLPAWVAPGRPSTLYDALMHLVHTPLPPETRREAQHDPSRGLSDLIRLRDTRCIGPGCSLPAWQCDLEHWKPHPTGDTSADNLGPASRRCHNAKTHGGWTYTPHPDGSVTWTTPWGQTYRKAPRTHGYDLTHLSRRPLNPPRSQQPSQGLDAVRDSAQLRAPVAPEDPEAPSGSQGRAEPDVA